MTVSHEINGDSKSSVNITQNRKRETKEQKREQEQIKPS